MSLCCRVGNAGNAPQKVMQLERWFDIAIIVTAVGLALFGTMAFLGIGGFATIGNTASTIGFATWGGAFFLIAFELLYGATQR